MKTYTLKIDGCETQTGLGKIEVVDIIYKHDGGSYWLEPNIVEIEDDDGNVTNLAQETASGTLVWEVWFKDPKGFKFKSCYEAYGDTEEEAEEAFLLEAFKKQSWSDDKFNVEEEVG